MFIRFPFAARASLSISMEECFAVDSAEDISKLVFTAASLIPISYYLFSLLSILFIFLYNFLDCHFLNDLLHAFRGNPVSLVYHPCSQIYDGVVSKCRILHARYLVTPWLTSPHLQTLFLTFNGTPPVFSYTRQLFQTSDGGTIAMDWLMPYDVSQGAPVMIGGIPKDDATPIVVVIPGLTSDSSSPYIKHLCFKIARRGWNVVVSNHRGLGGISLTSDRFYNAGWTEDLRKIVEYLHQEYPRAPLFSVGTSIGANVLVKYLGEDGDNTHISGAAAICSPWDLLICDRFISRKFVQRLYDKALTIGLQGYAQLHQSIYSRLADWEGIIKSRSVRDFDHYATCLVGKFETVDTYYRHCSSAGFVANVSVPLLCISALDDPLCTKEAIPCDECRTNKNVVLATTPHGGHLAFFEGLTANSLWWVRAVDEFLSVLHSSPFMHKPKKNTVIPTVSEPSISIDQGPYVSFMEDGMVSAVANEQTSKDMVGTFPNTQDEDITVETDLETKQQPEHHTEARERLAFDTTDLSKEESSEDQDVKSPHAAAPVIRCIDQLSRYTRRSMWLMAYIAIITTWPVLGSAIFVAFKSKFRNVLPTWMRK